MPGMFSAPAAATRAIDENGKTESRVNFTSSEDEKENGFQFRHFFELKISGRKFFEKFFSYFFFQVALKGPNNLNSDEDEESAEEESQPKATKKRKKLNSSDEEWAPKKKKKQEKKKSRKLSSSEDDMREMDEANMSDAVDEDYSDSEVTVKRSATVERAIHKFLQTASNSELQTVDTISGTFDDYFISLSN